MKREQLISDRRLRGIIGKIYDEHCHRHATPYMMLLAACATLKELRIVQVEKLAKHDIFKICGEAPVLEQGAILVVAKEKKS